MNTLNEHSMNTFGKGFLEQGTLPAKGALGVDGFLHKAPSSNSALRKALLRARSLFP